MTVEDSAWPLPLASVDALPAVADGLLLDQWGVLHDGHRPYPGAVAALQRLRRAGLRVVILSNSGRSGAENAGILHRMGFEPALFDAVVSAGDDARDAILRPDEPFHAALGRRCLLLARDSDAALADGLGREVLPATPAAVEQADFLLLMSLDAPRQSVAGWEPLLARAAARRLPMVCGNPDLDRVTPEGRLLEAPGRVAQRYAALGGPLRLHGKPHPRIYRHGLRLLAEQGVAAGRVVAVGDSLPHDIAGARAAGLRSVLVAGGVHAGRLAELTAADASARALFVEAGVVPDWIIASFR